MNVFPPTPADFLIDYPDPCFANIPIPAIQRAIDYVDCTWSGFSCYSDKCKSSLWGLAIAHTLEESGESGADQAAWFAPNVTTVKTYNDQISLTTDKGIFGFLNSTRYGIQLRALLRRSGRVTYFNGMGR
jgi:hypothetical protein